MKIAGSWTFYAPIRIGASKVEKAGSQKGARSSKPEVRLLEEYTLKPELQYYSDYSATRR
jgi:hypothetical protein